MRWVESAEGNMVPRNGHRLGATPGWSNLCLGRQLAMSFGSFLCVGEPPGDEEPVPGDLRQRANPSGVELPTQTAGHARIPCTRAREFATGRVINTWNP